MENTAVPFDGYSLFAGHAATRDDRESARNFLRAVGLENVPDDAVGQLLHAFVPALRVMCEREAEQKYSPEGAVWRKAGWRAQLQQVFRQIDRINWLAWMHDRPAENETIDAINALGFFHRGRADGIPRWGTWGEPGD